MGKYSCGNIDFGGNKELWKHRAVGTERLVGTKSFGDIGVWGQSLVGTESFRNIELWGQKVWLEHRAVETLDQRAGWENTALGTWRC